MDTREEYIDMCKTATEIQKQWEPEPGDFYRRSYTVFGEEMDKKIWKDEDLKGIEILVRPSHYVTDYIIATNEKGMTVTLMWDELQKKTCIWLPRIDQMMKILSAKAETRYGPMVGIVHWMHEMGGDDFAETFKSPEQLWLTFVMMLEHRKTWKDDEWIPCDDNGEPTKG